VKVGWVGRGGRSPLTVANTAARGGLSLNGTAPVKTFTQVNQALQMSIESTTDLNRDHREGEDIRLPAECPPIVIVQDLRCNPPCAVPILIWSAPDRIQVLSDNGQTTIRDHRMTSDVHKDVRLVSGCQHASGKSIKSNRVPP